MRQVAPGLWTTSCRPCTNPTFTLERRRLIPLSMLGSISWKGLHVWRIFAIKKNGKISFGTEMPYVVPCCAQNEGANSIGGVFGKSNYVFHSFWWRLHWSLLLPYEVCITSSKHPTLNTALPDAGVFVLGSQALMVLSRGEVKVMRYALVGKSVAGRALQ